MTRTRWTLEELLPVVVEVFLDKGYDATSMEDIARATGRTKSSVYHHVSGKEELLRLALTRGVSGLAAVLDEPFEGRAGERLEHVLRRSVEVLAADLPYVTVLLRVRGNTEAEQWALARRRDIDRRLAALVRKAIDEGDLRDDLDPKTVSRLLFGQVNSLVEWWRPTGPASVARTADTLVSLALEGLLRR